MGLNLLQHLRHRKNYLVLSDLLPYYTYVIFPIEEVTTINVQTFTASGTYTPTAGMQYCIVECVGGGGGGGGSASTTSTTSAAAGGGGGGGYCRKAFSAATIGVSQAVTVGAGGAGGAAGNNAGSNGTATTFGALLTANPGVGGAGGHADTITIDQSNIGGTATGGDVNVPGSPGQYGIAISLGTGATSIAIGGAGGNSFYGAGGVQAASQMAADFGENGLGYGAGGSGACSSGGGGTDPGGNGASGIVIVTEFI